MKSRWNSFLRLRVVYFVFREMDTSSIFTYKVDGLQTAANSSQNIFIQASNLNVSLTTGLEETLWNEKLRSTFINLIIFATDEEVLFVVLKYILISAHEWSSIFWNIFYSIFHVISAHTIFLEYSTHLTLGSSFRLRRLTNYPYTFIYGISSSSDIFAPDCFAYEKDS